MQKIISTVYNNKNRIPVNFDAVKEFFFDHEVVVDQTIRNNFCKQLLRNL
jgi:hypothetical protein